jgi:hypothetical protein
MYSDTTWQAEKGKVFTGMGFVIKKIVVHSESTKVRHGEAHYNMVRERWDARHLLEVRLYLCKKFVILTKCGEACMH